MSGCSEEKEAADCGPRAVVLAPCLLPGRQCMAWLSLLGTESRPLCLQGPRFSWKQTPARIHHMGSSGPSQLRPLVWLTISPAPRRELLGNTLSLRRA